MDEDIEHVAVLINSTLEMALLAIDFETDLIEVPFITGAGRDGARVGRILLPELPTPLMDHLVGHDHAALSQQVFDITIAEVEAD